jgi:Fe-S-cluster-containing hydrogenase component 2
LIYYFSGTGNSEYAAKKLAEKTSDKAVDIVDVMNGRAEIENNGVTGIVFPVYFWGLPEIIKRFSKKIKINTGDYVYAVITCGANTGTADKMLEKTLGRKMNYSFSLRMPDNYVVMYDPCKKEKAQRYLRHADKELEIICDEIGNKICKKSGASGGELNSFIVSKLYNPFRKTKKFFADDKCTSCGFCEKICPEGAIVIENGKPRWTKSKCQHCTACINRCPAKAIQYGKKTADRGRYSYYDTVKGENK